jgi:hypothetical protein
MADCIYLLVIQMTQMYYAVDSESGNISTLSNLKAATNYIVFFHGFFFLKCAMASQAPSNDLMAFNIAFQLQTIDEFKDFAVVGKVLYQSLSRHTWYLSPQQVVFALADKELNVEVKNNMLNKLLSYDVPVLQDLIKKKPESIIEIVPTSKLDDFVNDQSYLLFLLLDISKKELLLWKEKGIEACENEQTSQSFTYFSKCVRTLAVVNDRAERHIKLIQDFVERTRNEDRLRDTLQVFYYICAI